MTGFAHWYRRTSQAESAKGRPHDRGARRRGLIEEALFDPTRFHYGDRRAGGCRPKKTARAHGVLDLPLVPLESGTALDAGASERGWGVGRMSLPSAATRSPDPPAPMIFDQMPFDPPSWRRSEVHKEDIDGMAMVPLPWCLLFGNSIKLLSCAFGMPFVCTLSIKTPTFVLDRQPMPIRRRCSHGLGIEAHTRFTPAWFGSV